MREITDLIMNVSDEARKRRAKLSFCRVFPDRGRMMMREIGAVEPHRKGKEDEKTLDECHFEGGDFLDVAIL